VKRAQLQCTRSRIKSYCGQFVCLSQTPLEYTALDTTHPCCSAHNIPLLQCLVKACSRETHSLGRTSKIYEHKAFQNNTLSLTCHCYQQWPHSTTQHRTHCGVRCRASLSADCSCSPPADAAVTPTVSKMTYNVSSGTLDHTQPTD